MLSAVLRSSLIIGCALFATNLRSQNQVKADSIRNLIESRELTSNDELLAYYWLSAYSSSPEEELRYGKQLLDLATSSKNLEYQIKANQRIGTAHRLMGNLGEAIEHLLESANIAIGDEVHESLLAETYTEISACYTQNGDSKNALRYGLKTIEILRKSGREQELALNLLNLGYDHYLIGQYDSAMAYYAESEPILKEIGMTIGLAYITGNRALVYWKRGYIEAAKKDLYTAIDMLEPIGDQYGMADYYNQLGNIFLEEGKQDQAIAYATKSLEMSAAESLKEQARDASHLLFLLFKEAGDYLKAIDYQTQYYAYKDSIQNLETIQRLANLRTEFEVAQKQAIVDVLLEQQSSDQIKMIVGSITLFIVLCLGILVFSYSKSKTKLNEQLEEQKDSLMALNNTKDKFFSIISHDLRGPVNNLSGLVSVTKYFIDEKNTDQLREVTDKMETSVHRLVKLLDNLLHWSLQQRGHFPYLPENSSVQSIVEEAKDMFVDMATSKQIKLDLEVPEDFHLFVDRNTTSTIFRNLLNNAIKFTPTGGNVKVIAEKDQEANTGTIKVVDNGVGMPADKLNVLFRLNENITTRGTSGEAGLGLGLQLVYEFIQLNKGRIEVDSTEGMGTTFTVHLPLQSS